MGGQTITLPSTGPVLIRTVQDDTEYVRLSALNTGSRARHVSVLLADVIVLHATVPPGGRPFTVMEALPALFRTGARVTARLAGEGWQLPSMTQLAATVTLDPSGAVTGLSALDATAGAGASPVLLVVGDARRSDDDVDASKGSEGIIELFHEGGVVGSAVLRGGGRFSPNHLVVALATGVELWGEVFRPSTRN